MPPKLIRLIFVVYLTSATAAEDCPPPAEIPPVSIAADTSVDGSHLVAAPYSIVDDAGRHDYAPFGVGHLRVRREAEHYYDWIRGLALPLWRSPGGEALGWLLDRRVLPLDEPPFALTGAGLIETDYEHQTFAVFEVVEGGWFKIRLRPGAGGAAWTHRCHLARGKTRLEYRPWEEVIRERGDWLHFRARVPHALRVGPGVEHRRLTWIGLNHDLRLLALAGDWMRVEVRQPAWTCVGPDQPFRGTIHQGWVQWRDEQSGPWVWFYARGC